MTYKKQTWNKYDDLKTEEENIQNGAVVTGNRMNHMEDGISAIDLEVKSHESNKTNPHSVTKGQVGLSNVSNYGIATEAEATAGTSNAKYMTPSLTKKAAKSYVDKTDVGLSNVNNVKQASKSEFDEHTANKNNPHSVTATQVGAYTISETDSKLTDLSSKAVLNKGNLVSGTDLDNIINIGTYRIGGLTGGTDVINTPPELSGITIYAYLTVSGTITSVVQELVIYNSRAVSQIYSRSRSGSIPTFSPWSKTLVSDESGKVTVENIEVTGDYKKSTDTEMINLPLSGVTTATVSYQRKNGVVFVKGCGNWGNFEANKSRIVGTLPVGFRPPVDWPSGMNAMGGSQSMSASVAADGRVGITCDIKKDGVYGGFSTSFPVE